MPARWAKDRKRSRRVTSEGLFVVLRDVGWMVVLLVVTWSLVGCGPSGSAPSPDDELVVFAAASLRDVVTELGPVFEAQTGATLRVNSAGSNTLARQIAAAPGADAFVSADPLWVEFLAERGRLTGEPREVFSNRLVVVVNTASDYELDRLVGLADLDFAFLAVADPEAVPAGRYARAALEATPAVVDPPEGTVWHRLEDRLAPASDVRAALAMVEARPDVVGIVYASDLATARRARVLLEIPAEATPPIRYVASVVAGGRVELAERFLELLAAPEAQTLAEQLGFEAAGSEPVGE